ncbi:hypothetical protein LINGRAHAP2_LOCUS17482 [Linum grandiflorum]
MARNPVNSTPSRPQPQSNYTATLDARIRGRTRTITAYKLQAAFSKPGGSKKAHLSALRNKRLKLDHPFGNYNDTMSEFLSLPQGVESALNVKSVQSFQVLDDSTYRLVLPEVRLLSFDACPVMDLRVTTTAQDFTVEMLSFKFQGAKAMERQNDHIKGLMVSRIMWHSKGSESFLELKMQLDLTMELVELPFSLLPPPAFLIPGNFAG